MKKEHVPKNESPRPAELPVWHEELLGMKPGPGIYDGQQEWVKAEDARAYGLACIESAQAPKAGAVAWRIDWPGFYSVITTPPMSKVGVDGCKAITPLYEHPPTQPEVRALVAAARGYVGPANDPNIGWRGASASSLDHFRCEACGQEHLDCTAIPHKPDCKAIAFLKALSALEKAE